MLLSAFNSLALAVVFTDRHGMLSDIAVFGIRLLSSLVDMGDTFEVCCIGNYVLVF